MNHPELPQETIENFGRYLNDAAPPPGIYDQFVEKAKTLAENRKLGDPFEPDVVQGPQVGHLNK